MHSVEYISPNDFQEALRAMKKWGNRAKVIAGGTNLIPDMRSKISFTELIIDLSTLDDLSYVNEQNHMVSIGSLTTMAQLVSSRILKEYAPILCSAACQLGNPLTRNRATIGGNLAHASPAADMAPPLMALEATIHTERGNGKRRETPVHQFFKGPNETVLKQDEIIREITFWKPSDQVRASYVKLGLRISMAVSVVSVAVMFEMENTMCRKPRVALGAVAPTPIRAYRVERLLEGREPNSQTIAECLEAVTTEISPISDIRATAEYRRLVTPVLLRRAIQQALHEQSLEWRNRREELST